MARKRAEELLSEPETEVIGGVEVPEIPVKRVEKEEAKSNVSMRELQPVPVVPEKKKEEPLPDDPESLKKMILEMREKEAHFEKRISVLKTPVQEKPDVDENLYNHPKAQRLLRSRWNGDMNMPSRVEISEELGVSMDVVAKLIARYYFEHPKEIAISKREHVDIQNALKEA